MFNITLTCQGKKYIFFQLFFIFLDVACKINTKTVLLFITIVSIIK